MKSISVARLILILSFSGVSLTSQASIPSQKAPDQWLTQDGVVRGGSADNFMSLYDVRKSASAKLKTERLILDWGDAIGQVAKQGGYYQVEYQAKQKRVIVSLGLTLNSKVEGQVLSQRLSKGLYIKFAKLEFDPTNQTESLVLELKRSVKVRVQSYDQAPARLVVDLVE